MCYTPMELVDTCLSGFLSENAAIAKPAAAARMDARQPRQMKPRPPLPVQLRRDREVTTCAPDTIASNRGFFLKSDAVSRIAKRPGDWCPQCAQYWP